MTLGDLSACQSDADRAIQPAGALGQRGEEGLAEEEAFSRRSHRPKTQFASLIPAVQYYAPPEYRPLVPIPFEHPDKLFP